MLTWIFTYENAYLMPYIPEPVFFKLLEKVFSFRAVMSDQLLIKAKFLEYRTWNSLMSYMQMFFIVIKPKLGQEYMPLSNRGINQNAHSMGPKKSWTKLVDF